MKRIKGYCEVQKKEQIISVDRINAGTLADGTPTYIDGRIECEYGSFSNDKRCDECSVKKNGICI